MKAIRPRPGIFSNSSDGFTLIEVMVAMMVFAIVAVGIASALTSSLVITRDSRSREVAANLAAQEIDLDRSSNNVFNLGDIPAVPGGPVPATVVGGTKYYIKRSTHWITGDGGDSGCGTGAGTLQYKRINVSVTWDGMRASTPAVRADTLLAPSDRINDPMLGTIIVSVSTATGAGAVGVAVTATATPGVAGNTAVAVSGSNTDAQGCSYMLKVTPGTYDVTITRSGYLTDQQVASPIKKQNVLVTAGLSSTAGFVFDQAATFSATYPTSPVQLPNTLDTTLISTSGVFPFTDRPSSRNLFPVTGGYAVMTGKYVAPSLSDPQGCTSVDPGAWTADATTGFVGTRSSATTTGSVAIPMGILTLPGLSGKYVKAVSAASAVSGDPGCADAMTYVFPQITAAQTIALPFGSWLLYSGTTSTTQSTAVAASSITVTAPSVVSSTSNVVTLDPRLVAP